MSFDKATIWNSWLNLWNGDIAIADNLISPQFIAHFAPMSPTQGEVRGAEAFKQWIGGAVAAFDNHQFTTEVGPLADDGTIAGRWIFQGTYKGGIPGTPADAIGKPVRYYGIDIFRVENGQIVEYWLCADTMHLLQQIGLIPS
ncbi:MAG: ester cyclase [bacterium]|nr:ester cyclase [bacterium]